MRKELGRLMDLPGIMVRDLGMPSETCRSQFVVAVELEELASNIREYQQEQVPKMAVSFCVRMFSLRLRDGAHFPEDLVKGKCRFRVHDVHTKAHVVAPKYEIEDYPDSVDELIKEANE